MSDTKTLHKTSAQDLASWMGFGAAAAWEHRPPAISHSDELTCPASRSPQAQVCNMQQEPRIPPSPEHIPSGGSPAFGFLKLGCAIQRPKPSQADSQGLDVLDESTFEPSMSSLKSGSSFSAVSSSHAKLSRSSLPQKIRCHADFQSDSGFFLASGSTTDHCAALEGIIPSCLADNTLL